MVISRRKGERALREVEGEDTQRKDDSAYFIFVLDLLFTLW